MLGARQITRQEFTPYAMSADFCRIFFQEMNRLYLLALLLTADHALAEQCFVRGLDDSAKANRVFKDWACGWARRMVIQNAMQMIRPHSADADTSSSRYDRSERQAAAQPAGIAVILELPAFERFVLVVSVLEGYSELECSLFLNCARGEVIAARNRALQQIGRSGGARTTSLKNRAPHEDFQPAPLREPISHLAASA